MAFALIDCNNFFASCERIFRPELRGRPVVVLSNNDGCIIARSNEAKKLGIPMGAPLFKWKKVISDHDVAVFSPNFTLYGDISRRVMLTLKEVCPDVFIYSIDEAFLDLSSMKIENYEEFGRKIKDYIMKNVGMSVSVGIAETKTLAKLANHVAKKFEGYNGVCDFTSIDTNQRNEIFKIMPVSEVWGIGWGYQNFLKKSGIYNIYDLVNMNDYWIQKNLKVVGFRTVTELKGTPCISLHTNLENSKTIISSRSFGRAVLKKSELAEAVSLYCSRACEKLRRQESVASHVMVMVMTGKHQTGEGRFYSHTIRALPVATDYTPAIIEAALKGLDEIYKPGYLYKKALIMLSGVIPNSQVQQSLLVDDASYKKKRILMNTVDKINRSFGSRTVKIASSGVKNSWGMRQERRSQRYTTRWDEILEI